MSAGRQSAVHVVFRAIWYYVRCWHRDHHPNGWRVEAVLFIPVRLTHRGDLEHEDDQ